MESHPWKVSGGGKRKQDGDVWTEENKNMRGHTTPLPHLPLPPSPKIQHLVKKKNYSLLHCGEKLFVLSHKHLKLLALSTEMQKHVSILFLRLLQKYRMRIIQMFS